RTGGSAVQAQPGRADAGVRTQRSALDQARSARRRANLHAPGLLAHRALHRGRAALAARGLARRLPVPLPRLHVRPGRPRLQEQARAGQPRGAAAYLPVRLAPADRRRQQGVRGRHMAEFKEISPNATAVAKVNNWFENRFPTAYALYRDHMSEYYAPKNFNFWYFFGSLAMLVLVIQIVTGIFLVMHYKPDAAKAFESVEYIMR